MRIFMLLALFSGLLMPGVIADQSSESKLKAAYILNFARFVYWPSNLFEENNEVINLCLYKKCPIEKNLISLSNRTIQNRKILVRVAQEEAELSGCHVVFFSIVNEKENREAFTEVKGKNVLTVSDKPGFIGEGGLVEFVSVDGKTKFKINLSGSKDVGISYKTQLLEVAEIVR